MEECHSESPISFAKRFHNNELIGNLRFLPCPLI
jgi:hypothetical protein